MPGVEFPFYGFLHPILGAQYRPYASVGWSNENILVRGRFLIDSGADISVIPYKVGLTLGLEIGSNEQVYTLGGGTIGLPVVYRTLQLYLGQHQIDCRVAWGLSENSPAILGRLDVFEQFNVDFRQSEYKTIFTKT